MWTDSDEPFDGDQTGASREHCVRQRSALAITPINEPGLLGLPGASTGGFILLVHLGVYSNF
jgi:hypothetical protein